jgi:PAS domain S-box-containing protein
MEHAPVGFALFDTDFRFRAVNQKVAEINGVSVRDHIGRTVEKVVPDLAAKAREADGGCVIRAAFPLTRR